jgi:zinc protease
LREDQSLDDARQTLISTIENLASEPPSDQEVDRAKTRILKQFELLMTNTQSLALQLSDWASFGDWRLLFLMRDRIKTVTPQDVQRVAKTYLKESNRTVAEFIPTKTPDRAEIPQVTDIAAELKNFKGGAAISQGEAFDPSPANIESRTVRSRLPGGVKVSLLSKKTRGGTVDVALTVRFGDEKALFGKEIAADMAGGLLMRGTRNKTRQQIQDEIDRLKAQLIVTGGATSATASIRTTEANLPDALRLAVEILREPAFPEREFDQLRQQRIAGVEASRSDPRALASIALQKRLNPFPRGDVRYVSTAEEEIEDLQKTTLDDVRKFYQQFYGASEGELSVVGQFDPAATQKLVSDLLANWKSPSRYDRIVTPYSKTEPVKQRIETPDKQNAMFLAAMAVRMSDEDPDYPAMVVGNYILGGSGGSRLFSRIRNKEGLSYGVSSQFGAPTKEDRATFSASIISAPQNAPKAEASFLDELARTARDGFTAAEVAEAKKSLLESQVVARSQDQNLTRLLGNRQRFDRTMKFDEDLEARIAALTAEQVSAAFRRHIDPAGLVVIEAGDFKKAGVFQ